MEQFGVGNEPFFHGLEGGFASQSRLGKLMVVQEDIPVQGLRQVFARIEMVGFQDIADSPIEAFHHAVGLRGSGLGQAVLDAEGFAQLVELVFSRANYGDSLLNALISQRE